MRRRLWIADAESAMKAKLAQQQKAAEQSHEVREREMRNRMIWRIEKNRQNCSRSATHYQEGKRESPSKTTEQWVKERKWTNEFLRGPVLESRTFLPV